MEPAPHRLPLGQATAPNFGIKVPAGGYAWWYVDGISCDGKKAISVIGFIGAVFSPWYHWSGRLDPANHCSLNVVTYGRGGRFAMTDRRSGALIQRADKLTIGPSTMTWDGQCLTIDIDEVSSWPLVSRIRGRLSVTPSSYSSIALSLNVDGAHIWRPYAPSARIEVDLEAPGWRWSGNGYSDSNAGTRPLEDDFERWTWARFPTNTGALCMYSLSRSDGSEVSGRVITARGGDSEHKTGLSQSPLPTTKWGLRRAVGADVGTRPRQVMPLLGGPFYNRSIVQTQVDGEQITGVHETLDLRRYASPFVKGMIATRVPRKLT